MISALHFVQLLILCPPKLVIQEVGEICGEGERTGFSKMIPLRVVFQQCGMYNTGTGVCNKQLGGVVRPPHGPPLVISTKTS